MSLPLRHELARKSIHVATIVVPIAYARFGLGRTRLLIALGGLLVVALLVEVARARSARVQAAFGRSVGDLLRTHERVDAVGAAGVTAVRLSGATWMLVAFLLAVLLFPRDVAAAAMGAVALGDAAAAVVGRAIGRVRLAGIAGGKTLEGALACAAATLLGALFVARLGVVEALIAGVCAALAELPARPFDDNVRVALATGAGILLWRMTLY